MPKNRNPWSEEVIFIKEDLQLVSLVEDLGTSKWEQISKTISNTLQTPSRSGKQCRERWHNHLNPDINRNAWTESEKKLILSLHKSLGNRWSLIASHLVNRTDNSVKNFFYSRLRREDRKNKKKRNCQDFDKDATDILFQLSRQGGFRRFRKCTQSEDGEINMKEFMGNPYVVK
jgi:hypothetical protein